MVRSLSPLLLALAVAGCHATVPVNPDGSRQYGDTRQFILPTGMGLNVTRQGPQVEIGYPTEYPLTDAEAADYIERGTGCRPTTLISTRSTLYNGGTYRTYGLDCG